MTDAYPTHTRQEALRSFQGSFPSLFPEVHVRGLELFAVQPGSAMAEGVRKYVSYIEETIPHKTLRDYWPDVNEGEMTTLLSKAVTRWEKLKYDDGSVNAMTLHTMSLKDPRLITLAEGRAEAVLKSQRLRVTDREYPKTINNALFEFTNEVIVARLLNLLVTAYPHTVTPHFTTFLGCFRQSGRMIDQGAGDHVFALYERAHVSLETRFELEFRAGTARTDRLGARLFMTIFSLVAASHCAGVSHNDLDLRNIMEREVAGTAYAGAHWAYKLWNEPRYQLIPPSAHGDCMVEIIDLGRATITNTEPDNPGSVNALRFAYDVRDMLTDLCDLYDECTPPANRTGPMAELMARLEEHIDAWPQRQRYANDQLRQDDMDMALSIYRQWYTDDPVHGLGFLFADFMKMPAPEGVTPLVVAVTPSDNLLMAAGDDALVAELARVWRAPLPNTKRAYAATQCRTCGSQSAYTTEKGKHGFCGVDCYKVFYGSHRHDHAKKRKRGGEDDTNEKEKGKKARRDKTR